jgi:hypothetical protein
MLQSVPITGQEVEVLSAERVVRKVVTWYFERAYRRLEGPGTTPFYCDPGRVGAFAVQPTDLATGRGEALFKLFVGMAMFQARRDTLIMQQQRQLGSIGATALASASTLKRLVRSSPCAYLGGAATAFDTGCDVRKSGPLVDCASYPAAPCHVKEATRLLARTGDMGKMPTSAWLHFWKGKRIDDLLSEVCATELDPRQRAEHLVTRFSTVYRVGEKLAAMFVGALSTPALAPGLTPWFPRVDGRSLVVVDTHVAWAVDRLRGGRGGRTYAARATWLRGMAKRIDLRRYGSELESYSPRMVQQALFVFRSKSNRSAARDPCATARCADCVPELCPF